MTCWKVGRFVQRIVLPRSPGTKRIRSAVASARQAPDSPLGGLQLVAGLVDRGPERGTQADWTPAPQ